MCKIINLQDYRHGGDRKSNSQFVGGMIQEDKRFLKLRKSYKGYLEKYNWSDTLYAYGLYLQSIEYVREFRI